MKISKTLQALFLAASVATLAACGGGSTTSPIPVASGNTTITINPTTGPAFLQAMNGQTVSFASGIPALGTTGPTTISFSGSDFTVTETNTGKTATGPMTFGSCVFTATSSTLPGLPISKKVVIDPCTLQIPTAGIPANGQSVVVTVTWTLGTVVLLVSKATVAVLADGTVMMNGSVLGKIPVTNPTGATGGT